MRIKISIGKLSVSAELNNTSTAEKIFEVLPFAGPFNTWGDEIYFTIPVRSELDGSAQEVVEMGDLGYWPTGQAFCIFFGPTPMSTPGRIVPASAVNIVGRVEGDSTVFKGVMNETRVTVEVC